MLGDIKGWVWTKKELEHTRKIKSCYLLTEEQAERQNEAMRLKLLPVWDIATDDSGYLCFIQMPEASESFIWDIDKRDVLRFVEGDFIGEAKRGVVLSSYLNLVNPNMDLEDLKAANEEIKKKTGIDVLRMMNPH